VPKEANGDVFSIFSDQGKLSGLEASNFALFAATWWPKASFEELTVLLYFAIWLFNWDDEIDEPSGSYSNDPEGAEQYRARTTDFVRKCLNLPGRSAGVDPSQNRIIASFKDIGEPLATACTLGTYRNVSARAGWYQLEILLTVSPGQRKRFMAELRRFLAHTKREQQFQLRTQIPSLEEYWSFRMGSSAVGLVVAVQE
jgi:hypothetical protein